MIRGTGTLLHITSLPSQYGIGSLGKEAKKFIDWLELGGQNYWQILPINDLNDNVDNSPYRACSTKAGYPLLIDLDDLVDKGLLSPRDLRMEWSTEIDRVNFDLVRINKDKLLQKAFSNFNIHESHFKLFLDYNKEWLYDYSFYKIIRELKSVEGFNTDFYNISLISEKDKQDIINNNIEKFNYILFTQYIFFRQWNEIKNYANSKGIKIIGDMPMFMDKDSVEVWSKPQYFNFNEISGYPDDRHAHGSQVWGHPTYNWKELKKDKYEWWVDRFSYNSDMFDVLRVDHFLGFDRYWAIPHNQEAEKGVWKSAVDMKFFDLIKKSIKDIPIIAETIGIETDNSKYMLEKTGFYDTNIVQWTSVFGGIEVHTYRNKSVVYTGTHDTDTLRGWELNCNHNKDSYVYEYFNTGEPTLNWNIIKSLIKSNAILVILNMQDILGLDNQARFNTPGIIEHQWEWRLPNGLLSTELAMKLKRLNSMFGRCSN